MKIFTKKSIDDIIDDEELLYDDKIYLFIDIKVLKNFIRWVDENGKNKYFENINIMIIKEHFDLLQDKDSILENIEILNLKKYFGLLTDRYIEKISYEILFSYFNGDTSRLKSAQILAYARIQSEDFHTNIKLLSDDDNFGIIPYVDYYFIPFYKSSKRNYQEIYRSIFFALDFYKYIDSDNINRLNNGDYTVVIIETIKKFFEKIRHVSNIQEDGYTLVEKAFKCTKPSNLNPSGVLPIIQLNKLSNQSEWNEQQGICNIACGLATAIRNPLAHSPIDETFIRERFSDPKTALKLLSLISFLFEKLDQRVGP